MAKKESVNQKIKKEMRSRLNGIDHNLTRSQYRRDGERFVKYCRAQHDVHSLSDCAQYIQDYSDYLQANGYTASTIHTYIAAACRICDVSISTISKPVRRSADYMRGRRYDRTEDNYISSTDLQRMEWRRLFALQEVAGLRRAELKKLKGSDLIIDESGYLCIQVRRGKGGKYQLQRLHPKDYELVHAIFDNVGADEYVFSAKEMNNRLNLHALRAQHAREVYSDYVYRIKNEPGYTEHLKKEILARWNQYNIDPATGKPKPFPYHEIEGEYVLRGANKEFAKKHGLPIHYNKLAVMATSIFALSHWRNNVTVTSYLLAI